MEVVLNCFLTRLNCFGTDRKVLTLPRNKLVEARRALRFIRLYIFATCHSDHKLHNDQIQIIQIYSHSSNGFVICMLWFAYGWVWSFVCCCLDTTSLWACSIKGHRIDRTLQLQPEADIISSISSSSSFLCHTLSNLIFFVFTKSNRQSKHDIANLQYMRPVWPSFNSCHIRAKRILTAKRSSPISFQQNILLFPYLEVRENNKNCKNKRNTAKTRQHLHLSLLPICPFPQSPLKNKEKYKNYWQLGRLDVQRLSQIP